MKKRIYLMIRIILLSTLVASGTIKDHNTTEKYSEEIPSFDVIAPLRTEYGLDIGQKAPDFTLEMLDGEKLTLSDLKGKKVLLNFWASWCPPCREEMPLMQSVYEEFQDEIEIIAVNITFDGETRQSALNFAVQHGLTFPIPLDIDGHVTNLYKIMPIPTSYFIDTEGIIRGKYFGPMTEEYILGQFEKF